MNATAPASGAGRPAQVALLALAVLTTAFLGSARADHGPTPCQGQDVPISRHTLTDAERASLCLVNVYRQGFGLEPLVFSPELAGAARDHSEDMVERDYFAHVSPDGTSPQDRAEAAGYGGQVGENIVVSGKPDSTPHQLFNIWRASEPHNRNMLSQNPYTGQPVPYMAAAVGLALGAPEITADGNMLGPGGVTGTQLFGTTAPSGGYTALEMAGGDPGKTSECGRAKSARSKAKRAWEKAKAERRKAQSKLRAAKSKNRREQLAEKLAHKRKQVAKRRAELRRATAKQEAVC